MEVRSEQGLMAGRDLFGLTKSPPAPAPPSSAAMQSVRMAYTADGTAVFAPVSSSPATPSYQPQGAAHGASMSAATVVGGNGAPAAPSMGEPLAKKKRGRPRKYGPDGSMALAMVPASAASGSPATGQGFSGPFSPPALNPASSLVVASPDGFKKRGRPKGSTNKPRVDAAGSSGAGFTPHVITVQAGEDVASKIMSFSQHGTHGVCVLSANGSISNVTLRQTATSGRTVTYEVRAYGQRNLLLGEIETVSSF